MKCEQTIYKNPLTLSGRQIVNGIGVTVSAYNAVVLADRTLRDGSTINDGHQKVIGSTFLGLWGQSDELHYDASHMPSLQQRVEALERLVSSAQMQLERLDPDGLVQLRGADCLNRIAKAVNTR